MLKEFDDAMRSAAELVANVDRDVRKKLVRVAGREERYSENLSPFWMSDWTVSRTAAYRGM